MTISDTSTIIGNGFRNADLRDLDAASLALAVEQTTGVDQKLHDAMSLASLAHRHQTRPGRNGTLDPYITHPLRNTLRLIGFGCTDTTVLAATALHDTVEDQPEQLVALLEGDASAPTRDEALRQLANHFGVAVAEIVDAVSNPPKPANLIPAEKNEHYAAHVTATITDPRAFLVKVSDFIDNAGSLGNLQDVDKRNRLRGKYAPLVPAFAAAADRHEDTHGLNQDGHGGLVAELRTLAIDLEPTV